MGGQLVCRQRSKGEGSEFAIRHPADAHLRPESNDVLSQQVRPPEGPVRGDELDGWPQDDKGREERIGAQLVHAPLNGGHEAEVVWAQVPLHEEPGRAALRPV
jgi:hypothetical protein